MERRKKGIMALTLRWRGERVEWSVEGEVELSCQVDLDAGCG